jgi:prepilin-type N-terminal cleavage/methylation domain-containing protein/prepilin-type processing-associated H-X9-DG protein
LRQRYRPGFTLCELLTVVAILLALAAILSPVFVRARAAANAAQCTANLKQIGLAFRLYQEDHDDQFPPNGVTFIQSVEEIDRLWFRQLQPYLKGNHLLHCPADNVRNACRTFSAALPSEHDRPDLPALSYGANLDLMQGTADGQPRKHAAAVDAASDTLLVADCTEPWVFGPVYTERNGVRWSHVAYANGPAVFHAPSLYYHGGRSESGHERHRAGSYVAFLDGHVAFLRAERFHRRWRREATTPDGPTRKVLEQWPLVSPEAVLPNRE